MYLVLFESNRVNKLIYFSYFSHVILCRNRTKKTSFISPSIAQETRTNAYHCKWKIVTRHGEINSILPQRDSRLDWSVNRSGNQALAAPPRWTFCHPPIGARIRSGELSAAHSHTEWYRYEYIYISCALCTIVLPGGFATRWTVCELSYLHLAAPVFPCVRWTQPQPAPHDATYSSLSCSSVHSDFVTPSLFVTFYSSYTWRFSRSFGNSTVIAASTPQNYFVDVCFDCIFRASEYNFLS